MAEGIVWTGEAGLCPGVLPVIRGVGIRIMVIGTLFALPNP